jgi:hypothetical protein
MANHICSQTHHHGPPDISNIFSKRKLPRPALLWPLLALMAFATSVSAEATGSSESQARGEGAVFRIDPEILRALPGDIDLLIGVLETRTRLRPGGSIAGIPVRIAAERREIFTGEKSDYGVFVLSLSPQGMFGESGHWNLTTLSTLLPPSDSRDENHTQVVVGAQTNSFGGITADGQLKVLPRKLWNTTVTADMSLHYTGSDDMDPRATADGSLPNNDGAKMDLVAGLHFGSPDPGSVPPSAGSGGENQKWGLNLALVSRGTTRNHYLKEYEYNLDHAPHEETALFQTQAQLHYQLSSSSTARFTLGYDRYLHWLGDGVAKTNLSGYTRFQEEGNGEPDPSGLYWADPDGSATRAHVYDYFVRNFTTTLRMALGLDHTFSPKSIAGFRLERDNHSYHRYEHFSPISYLQGSGGSFQDAVIIGYEEDGTSTSDQFSKPGDATITRAGLWSKHQLGRSAWLDMGLAGHWFDSGEASLLNPRRPMGEDSNFTEEDLTATETKFDPVGKLAIRIRSGKWDFWGLGYRTTHLPPLEALYSPTAYLLPTPKDEGVMGNPDLAPEKETGAELGFSRQMRLFGRPFTLQVAGYAARIDDALTLLTASYDVASQSRHLLTYDNGGELQQMGMHLDGTFVMIPGTTGKGPLWMRLSYDLSRTESDHLEPTLLNNSWLHPNDPTGEYESQGYEGRLGGLYDIIGENGWNSAHGNALDYGNFYPSDLDRTHRFSTALIWQTGTAERRASKLRKWLSDWTIGALFTLETGRPYSQTYIHKAGLVAQPEHYLELDQPDPLLTSPDPNVDRNSGRIDTAYTLDLAFTRWLKIGNRRLQISLEALNVLGTENQTVVYRATGDADSDGCQEYGYIPEGVTEEDYQARLQDPRHYDRALTLRAGVAIAIP